MAIIKEISLKKTNRLDAHRFYEDSFKLDLILQE